MLFDLRGRHRRRLVRVIYIGLAVLIGVGLVGFGIGGGLGGGGIFNAASSNEGSSGASFQSQIKKYRKEIQTQPKNPAGYEGLAKALLHEGGREAYTSPTTGAVTKKGKELFREASATWVAYLALNPPKLNAELAQLITRIYGEAGLNEPAKAVEALNIVVKERPNSAHFYSELAIYAYKAKNVRLGDLASAKAVALAPATDRVRLKKEFEEAKKFPNGGQSFVTTTNGKTYRVKKAPNGEFTGTQITTTPAPATTSTSSTTTTKK